MRLWHKDLLPYLDNFHIVSQYRELLAIKRAIDKNGTPNHRLVNKVLYYSIYEFREYAWLVKVELDKREIKYNIKNMVEILEWESGKFAKPKNPLISELYKDWHNARYLTQCYYNLQEKYDCGIVSKEAWERIDKFYKENNNATPF